MTNSNQQENSRTRTALVKGGSQRIGAAIVHDLAKNGFKVVIHYHSSQRLARETADEIKQDGGTAEILQADLANTDDCENLIAAAREVAGPVDLLVNNASVFKHDSASNPDLGVWQEHMAVNVRAPALLTSRIAQQGDIGCGVIINLIDQRVWALTPNYFSYTLSKSALWTATRTMALEFAPKIRVNAIGPGPTLPNARQSQDDFEAQRDGLILRRGPMLDEFGATIRYLYEMNSITGQMIALDGGQHLAWETPDVIGANECTTRQKALKLLLCRKTAIC